MVKKWITGFIDFFYPPFSKLMPLQTFRYAVCGGTNTLLDIFLYWVSFHFILHEHNTNLGLFTASPYELSVVIAFSISFPTGFFLNKNIVFTQSSLHNRVQLFRYFVLVCICLGLNYIFIKLFVEQFHFYATVAKIFTTVIVVSFSYLTQKHFTFKSDAANSDIAAGAVPIGQPEPLDQSLPAE
ncbi:MAG TPA: GtrA family protein [Puia sp.]|jgi:putative flippase GtrA|nr:GtrA family protein [Puia sp.]